MRNPENPKHFFLARSVAPELVEAGDIVELGLDGQKFSECLAQKPHAAAIDKDIEDGQKVGVSGTPAFFINGRMLSGAQPFEKFKELIDEELATAGKS